MNLRTYVARMAICCMIATSTVSAQSPNQVDPGSAVAQAVAHDDGRGQVEQVGCFGCGEVDCGCEPTCTAPAACDSEGCAGGGCSSGGCDRGDCGSCGLIGPGDCCETCGDCDCDGGLIGGHCLGKNSLGDPCSIFGNCGNFSIGGWVQLGYHDHDNILFNNRKNDFQLQQGWLYAEKSLDLEDGFDWGGRIDYVYGTDGPDTQAFGDPDGDGHWDNDWDNGGDYGHAIPQLYLEAGFGQFSAKVGHFYTTIGQEVVQAPQNFFYSHAYTMYNSEPFTHTGVLFNYEMTEDIELTAGWVFGWDSGFVDNGDAFLGGASVALTDDIQVTSMTSAGRFGENALNENGFMHSLVAAVQLCEGWQYIFQNDILDTEDASGNTVRDTLGINQYLIHTLCDRLAYGARFEWWNVEGDSTRYSFLPGVVNDDVDVFALTLGFNIKPCANCIIRPEYRWDWVDGNQQLAGANQPILEDGDNSQETFAIDTIFLF